MGGPRTWRDCHYNLLALGILSSGIYQTLSILEDGMYS